MIICSVNTKVTNKSTDWTSLRDDYKPFSGTIEELVNHVKLGHAFTPAVIKPNSDGTYTRINDNFDRAELVALDIDNSVTLPDKTKRKKTPEEGYYSFENCCRSQYVNQFALFAYTTPSHTEEHNRFRLVFQLPEPLVGFQQYKDILMAYINRTDSDTACSDPVRTFYGNTEAEVVIFGGKLTDEEVLKTLNYKHGVKLEEEDAVVRINGQLTEQHVRDMLAVIPPNGDYMDWCKIISAVASRFDERTTERLIEEWSPGQTGEVAKKIKHRLQRVNIGTLVWHAKKNAWEPPVGFYKAKPTEFPLTDSGNAERFILEYGKKAQYEHTGKCWYIWDGTRFKQDKVGLAVRYALNSCRKLYNEAEKIEDEKLRDITKKFARKSESKQSLSSTLGLAGNDTGETGTLAKIIESFDAQPLQINLKNGIFNLSDFTLYNHDYEQYHTKLVPINFDNHATCPKWLEFLAVVFAEDVAMIEFIQRAVGYSLTGLISEQCLFFCHGSGKNGKSIFFSVMEMITGDYHQKAPTEMLLAKRQEGGIPNDVARLRGARFVSASELPDRKRFDEAKIKDLTGGDRIVARFLHGEFFEFNPSHKLWIYGNHKPTVSGNDEGIWRRINLIPFNVTIPPERRRASEELMAEFHAEASGILKWALDGYYKWSKDGGLKTPQQVLDATRAYRSEMDVVGSFLEQTIDKDVHSKVKFTELYDKYASWCIKNGEHALRSRAFNAQVREKGFEGAQGSQVYEWHGMKFHGENLF